MNKSRSDQVKRFYAQFSSDDNVLVAINADPDAIASAMAVKRLLWRKVAGVTISSVNVIKRPDNLAMIRLLRVTVVPWEEIDFSRFSRVIYVDSQPDHCKEFGGLPADLIIDHHPDTGHPAPYRDIRPQYGANASILTEYIRSARIKPSVYLATGLFYAIKTDTNNFKRTAGIEDVRAFQYLFRHANTHLVQKFEQAELKPGFLKFFKLALDQVRIRKGRAFVHLGRVPTPDLLVIIADFFMRVNNVSWSIVSGLHNKKLIVIFRNDGIRKNAGKLAQESFGALGSAGGHKSMARAEIAYNDIKDLVDVRDDQKMSRWVLRQFDSKTRTPARKPKPAKGP